MQTPPSPASLISVFSPPPPLPTLFLSSFSVSFLFLHLSFPVFPGLGCHQWLFYPFLHSPVNIGLSRISHEPQSLHIEHRRNQAVFLIEVMLPHLIRLKEIVCRKELSHRVRGIPFCLLWQRIPVTACGPSILSLLSPSPPEVSNRLPLWRRGGVSRLKSLHNFTGLFPGPEVGLVTLGL